MFKIKYLFNKLKGLLEKDPEKRIGVKNKNEIKNHIFFKDLDWEKVLNCQYLPPQLDFEDNDES